MERFLVKMAVFLLMVAAVGAYVIFMPNLPGDWH